MQPIPRCVDVAGEQVRFVAGGTGYWVAARFVAGVLRRVPLILLPGLPDRCAGVVEAQGRLVPVFTLPGQDQVLHQREVGWLVVLDLGEACVAVIVDGVGGVAPLGAPRAGGVVGTAATAGAAGGTGGTCDRCFDPAELLLASGSTLSGPTLSGPTLSGPTPSPQTASQRTDPACPSDLLRIVVAGQAFAVPLSGVAGVARVRGNAPSTVEVRGVTRVVVDLGTRLGLGALPGDVPSPRRLVLLDRPLVAWLVDEVEEVVSKESVRPRALPSLPVPGARSVAVTWAAQVGERLIPVLDMPVAS